MPSTIDTIVALINSNVGNYPNQAFQNNMMRTILLLMTGQLPGGGSGAEFAGPFELNSSNFTSATNCPIPLLNGLNILVFFNDTGKFLTKGSDWIDLVGGGFTITIPGFDSTTANYTFYVSIKGN